MIALEKQTISNWEYIGNEAFLRSFDKIAKSFVISIFEKDSKLRYPKSIFDMKESSPSNSFGAS